MVAKKGLRTISPKLLQHFPMQLLKEIRKAYNPLSPAAVSMSSPQGHVSAFSDESGKSPERISSQDIAEAQKHDTYNRKKKVSGRKRCVGCVGSVPRKRRRQKRRTSPRSHQRRERRKVEAKVIP